MRLVRVVADYVNDADVMILPNLSMVGLAPSYCVSMFIIVYFYVLFFISYRLSQQ